MVRSHKQDLSSSTTLTSSSSSEPDTNGIQYATLPEEPSLMDLPITPPLPLGKSKQKDMQPTEQHQFSPFPQHYPDYPERTYSPTPSEAPSTSSLADHAANYLAYIHSLAQGFLGELEDVNAFLEQQPDHSSSVSPTPLDAEGEVDVQVVEIDCRASAAAASSSTHGNAGNSGANTRVVGIDNAETLTRYLDEDDGTSVTEGEVVRAYLVQAVTPQTIALLGAKFDVDPRFWDGHLRRTDDAETSGEHRVAVMLQSPREGFSDEVEGALHLPLARTWFAEEASGPLIDVVDATSDAGTVGPDPVHNAKGRKSGKVSNDRCSVYLPSNSSSIIIVFSATPYRSSLLHRILVSPTFCPALSPPNRGNNALSSSRAVLRLLDALTATITQSWSQELVVSSKRVKDACRSHNRASWLPSWKKTPDLSPSVTKERRRAVNAVKGIRDLLLVVENLADEGMNIKNTDDIDCERSVLKRDLAAVKRRVRGFEEGVWSWDIGVDEQVWAVLGEGRQSGGLVAGWTAALVAVVLGVLLIVQLTIGT